MSDQTQVSSTNLVMDPETLEALKGSIRKWEGIVNGTEVDKGVENCPLCQMFAAKYAECEGCPVFEITRKQACRDTPYDQWHDVNPWPRKHPEWRDAKTPEHLVAAQAELDFLKSLLPKEST